MERKSVLGFMAVIALNVLCWGLVCWALFWLWVAPAAGARFDQRADGAVADPAFGG